MRTRKVILILVSALAMTLGFAYLTHVHDPIRPYMDWGLDEPEKTLDRGAKSTFKPVDDSSASPTPTDEVEYCGEDGDCNKEDRDERDPADICASRGEEWDGERCVAVQLPEERIGRIIEGPNGETCIVVDTKGNMKCNLPDEVGTPPLPSCD
jgi:hypothetical protein